MNVSRRHLLVKPSWQLRRYFLFPEFHVAGILLNPNTKSSTLHLANCVATPKMA
jgi:hypothetical protein